MFSRHLFILRTFKQVSIFRTYTTETHHSLPKWDVLCGVCLIRKPVISRSPRTIEKKFLQMLQKVENENSMKSDHELRQEADMRRAEEFKKGRISTSDVNQALVETAAEFEDKNQKDLQSFTPASRITEADEKNDLKSTDRKLDKNLLFITKENIGNNEQWVFPQDKLQEQESLRQAAERIIKEKYGRKTKVKFYGNAPCGYYKYKYPKPVRENTEAVGAKIFFMKVQYLTGILQERETLKDYCWITKKELSDHLVPSYQSAVNSFLLDDEEVTE